MSLINCVECNREFSNTRPDCPHCGAYLEGQAPSQAIAPELMEVVEERKYKKKILDALKSIGFSKNLKTFKNGLLRSRRSLAFSYVHGEVVSFNSYIDTDLNVTRTTVNEISAVEKKRDVLGDEFMSGVKTRARDVVSDVSLTKTKITELAVKLWNREIKKYFFRGPEIEFLRTGDPVSLGFLRMDRYNHIDDIKQYGSWGILYNNEPCPVILINRAVDAHKSSHFITAPETFEDDIFDDKLGVLRYGILGALVLDLFAGTWPTFGILTAVALVVAKVLMLRGQSERRKSYNNWWHKQVHDVQNIKD